MQAERAGSPTEEQARLAPPAERRLTVEPFDDRAPKSRPLGMSQLMAERPEWARAAAGGGGSPGASGAATPVAAEPPPGAPRSPSLAEGRLHSHFSHAEGPRTWGRKYMAFASGFEHVHEEAAVYRPAQLAAVNPTAACDDDTSYYFTLDSGAHTAATKGADPNRPDREHVRDTAAGSKGGLFKALLNPIR